MPVYDLAAVAQAVDLEEKQLDNLISRNALRGLEKNRRGIARRFTPELVVMIKLAKDIGDTLGLPTGSLFPVADRVMQSGGELNVGSFGVLQVDLTSLRESIIARLGTAVEEVGRRKRGRPPTRRNTSTHGDA